MVAQGHSVHDIFFAQQPNLPYSGWTQHQFKFWAQKASVFYNRQLALMSDQFRLSIASIFDKKAMNAYSKRQSELRKT